MAPTVSNDCAVNPQNAPSPVSNDCTHIIYQYPRTDKRYPFPPPILRLETASTSAGHDSMDAAETSSWGKFVRSRWTCAKPWTVTR